MEPPAASILEMVHDNPNALHHLVCEGDAAGVKFVRFNFCVVACTAHTVSH
jgi:hypothetical protein